MGHRRNDWTWRFGFSTGDQPIPPSEVLFNILAPGVMEEHFTFGFSRKTGASGERQLLAHVRPVGQRHPDPTRWRLPGLQTIELEMDQWDLEFGYSWGF